MIKQDRTPTREKILRVAAKMFSERGYDGVSTRDIANVIGINSASIYYHFPSKAALLQSLFRLYSTERQKQSPDLEELLRLAETDSPHAVLMKSAFYYSDEMSEILDQIIVVATHGIGINPESDCFIRENIFDPTRNTLKPLLERMVELGRINPFDINAFLGIFSFYCYSAAALNNSSFKQSIAEFQSAMSYLFSLIAPIASKQK